MRRGLALFAVLFAAYAATTGVDGRPGSRLTTPEAHVLLTAESIVSDGDIDLRDEYIDESWRKFGSERLRPEAVTTRGMLNESQGIAFPALVAPAYAIGGAPLVELFLAAVTALAFALAAALARQLAPDPWASGAVLALGLSPPALGAATAVSPETTGALLLAVGALLALRVRVAPRPRRAIGCALVVAILPWLAPDFGLPTAVIAFALWRWLRRRQRGLTGFFAVEVMFLSLVVYFTVNNQLFGGLIPHDAAFPGSGGLTGADEIADYAGRATRLVGLWLDRDVGLLVWAPFVAMSGAGAWALWTSHRDLLATAIAGRTDTEVAAALCLAVALAVWGTATFVAPTADGPWFPGHYLVPSLPFLGALAAWGLHRHRRIGAGLAAITVAGSIWLLAAVRLDGAAALQPPRGDLPWGGLQDLLPRFGDGSEGELIAIALAVAAFALLVARELKRRATRAGAAS